MRKTCIAILFWSCCSFCFGQNKSLNVDWIKKVNPSFDIFYSTQDSSISPLITEMVNKGEKQVTVFFEHPFKHKFSVYVFPTRKKLDEQWQLDYGDTSVHSECWMVASGIGDELQILSPEAWKNEACEHNADDTAAMQKLITHELVHVYQGQYNPIHDFTGLDSLAWFIEGIAVYASGQVDEARMEQVKQLITSGKEPTQLKFFWTGKARYALAGSMVKFIADKYGKQKLFELLSQTDQRVMLQMLNTDEGELISSWKKSLK